jgi:acylphosphatase
MALKITIKGIVHNVGYRAFLLEEADNLLIPNFKARNVKIGGKEALIVLVDGDKEQLENFLKFVKENVFPKAVVEEIKVE